MSIENGMVLNAPYSTEPCGLFAEYPPSDSIPESDPVCPVCGEPCSTYYLNDLMDVCGCENCVRRVNARDYQEAEASYV